MKMSMRLVTVLVLVNEFLSCYHLVGHRTLLLFFFLMLLQIIKVFLVRISENFSPKLQQQ